MDAKAVAGRRFGRALRAALALCTLACLQLSWLPAGYAQLGAVDPENVVDWYYAPIFGTGIYASGSRSDPLLLFRPARFPSVQQPRESAARGV